MTYPTRGICPILLEDMRKVMVERKGDTNFFTSKDIQNCMKKVIPLDLHQTITLPSSSPGDLPCIIKPYYAGKRVLIYHF
jgi:integrator complex subunit 11